MAVSTSETPAKKLKKHASVAELAPTPAPTPDGETETTKKRKKKHADTVLNGAGASVDETPAKALKKEKKAKKDRTEHSNVPDDLELVVTRLDAALGKEDKKRRRRKSEVAPVEESAPVEEEAAAETPSPEKKKKKEKRKSEAAGASVEVPPVDAVVQEIAQESAQTPKERKRKRKVITPAPETEDSMAVDAPAPIPSTSEPAPSKKEKKKKRKSEVAPMDVDTPAPAPESSPGSAVEVGSSMNEPLKKEKKKKRKADATDSADSALPDAATTTVDPVTPAKEKKRKRKEAEDAMDVDTPAKPAKKSKAGEIPDPSNDEALSPSGKEALVYAYTHQKHPAVFKFNKAKQNWLVRNMWKLDEIPEAYTPLLAPYLGTIQGQLRKSLPNICKDRIDATDEPEPIRARAQACRDALVANEPVA